MRWGDAKCEAWPSAVYCTAGKNKAIEGVGMQMSWSQPDDSRGVCAEGGEAQNSLKLVPEDAKVKAESDNGRLKRNG